MTSYEHLWGWARSLNVAQMDEFIKKCEHKTTETIVIFHNGEKKTHVVGDVLAAVRFCREEYRKDQRMGNPEEE